MIAFDPAGYAVNVVIHATLLSLATWLVIHGFKNPFSRSWLAALGLVSIASLPFITALAVPHRESIDVVSPRMIAPAIMQNAPQEWVRVNPSGLPPSLPSGTADPQWELPDTGTLLLIAWVTGFIIRVLYLGIVQFRLSKCIHRMREAGSADLAMVDRCLSNLPNRCQILISDSGHSPMITGLFKPRLIIPECLFAPGKSRELAWALRHEAEHFSGRDIQCLTLFQFVLSIYWWNPIAFRLLSTWADSRELICDRHAVSTDQDRALYGRFLISLGERSSHGTVLGMASRRNLKSLRTRIQYLMTASHCLKCRPSFFGASILLTFILSFALTHVGVKAENPKGPSTTPPTATPAPTEEGYELRQRPNSIKMTLHLLVTTKPLVSNGETFSDAEADALIEQVEALPEAIVSKFPGVVASSNRSATVELIREHPDTPQLEQEIQNPWFVKQVRTQRPLDDPDYRFSGFRLMLHPEISGDSVNLQCHAVHGYSPEFDYRSLQSESVQWEQVEQHSARADGTLKPGESLAVDFGMIGISRNVTMIVQASPIDPTGRPLADYSATLSKQPRPLPPEKVRVSGTLLALPAEHAAGMNDFFNQTLLLGIYSEEQFKGMRKSFKGEITDLPPVEFMTENRFRNLWDQRPDLAFQFHHSNPLVFDIGLKQKSGTSMAWSCFCDQTTAVGLYWPDEDRREILFLKVEVADNPSKSGVTE